MGKRIKSRFMAFFLATAVFMQSGSVSVLAESKTVKTDESENVVDSIVLESQEVSDDIVQAVPVDDQQFKIDSEKMITQKEKGTAEQNSVQSASYENNGISNDYLEFYYYDGGGQFGMSTTGGLESTISDNYKLLLYGSSTSYTTIRVDGKDYIFHASTAVYDRTALKATSQMNADGVLVTQTLQIVENSNTGKKDTVQISYSYKNTTASAKSVGIRIMLDTMLGSNDGVPFKIPSVGNLTKEREFNGTSIPQYWQAYDSFTNPTVYAIGTVYKSGTRKPSKLQYAYWPKITGTVWDYTVDPNCEFAENTTNRNDSAVALYWNPTSVASGASSSVCTYYGVGRMNGDTGSGTSANEIDPSQYTVTVLNNSGDDYISGATVSLMSDSDTVLSSAITDANGQARFATIPSGNSYIKISKSGYEDKYIYKSPALGKSEGCTIQASSSTRPYISGISFKNASTGETTDLMNDNMSVTHYSEDNSDETKGTLKMMLGSNSSDITKYQLIQDSQVKAESSTGTFSDLNLSSKLSVGKKVYARAKTANGTTTERILLGILVYEESGLHSTSSGDGNISVFGDGLTTTLPDNVPVVGGSKFTVDFPSVPYKVDIDGAGKVKFEIGMDQDDFPKNKSDKDAVDQWWDKTHDSWNKALSDYEKSYSYSPEKSGLIEQTVDSMSGFKLKYQVAAYGEGSVNPDTNAVTIDVTVLVMVGGKATLSHTYATAIGPICVEGALEGSLSDTPRLRLVSGHNDDGSVSWDFDLSGGTVELDIGLSLYGGYGIAKVANVEAGGKADILWDYTFKSAFNKILGKIYASIKVNLLLFHYELPLYKGEKVFAQWYSDSGAQKSSVQGGGDSIADAIYDASNYSMISRDYLKTVPDTSDASETAVGADAASLENVYTNASPKVMYINGYYYEFYLADIASRDDANRTALCYVKSTDAVNWSNPVYINDDSTADFNYAVTLGGNNIYVAWQNSREELTSSMTVNETAVLSDIYTASIDTTSSNSIKVVRVTDDTKADILPAIAVSDSSKNSADIVWFTNSDSDILTQRGTNTIKTTTVNFDAVSEATAPVGSSRYADEEADDEKDIIVTETELSPELATVSENSLSENVVPDETISENMTPTENSESDNSISDNSVQEDTVSSDTVSDDTVSVNIAEVETAGSISVNEIVSYTDKPITDIATGMLGSDLVIAYTLDIDGNLTTAEDQELYISTGSGEPTRITNDGAADTNPEFGTLENISSLVWYKNSNLYKLTTANGSAESVFASSVNGLTDSFALNDNKIEYISTKQEGVGVSGNVISCVYEIDADGTYPYIIKQGEASHILTCLSVANDAISTMDSYTDSSDVERADIDVNKISRVPDLSLNMVTLSQNEVRPGASLPIELQITNNGSADVSSNTIYIGDTSSVINTPIKAGETVKVSQNYAVPDDLEEVTRLICRVNCSNDSNSDNDTYTTNIGYTDVSVDVDRFLSGGQYYGNVKVANNSGITAKDVVLRVLSDEEDGAIIYENEIGDIPAGDVYALQVNMLYIARNKSIDKLYFTVTSSNGEYYSNNNTFFEFIHYLWNNSDTYSLDIMAGTGGTVTGAVSGYYAADTYMTVRAIPAKGYDFKCWELSSGDGQIIDLESEVTGFKTADMDTALMAVFEPSAFKGLDRTISVGDTVLITPVYEGTWSISGNDQALKITDKSSTRKVTGLNPGNVSLIYTGNGSEGIQKINFHVYALSDITVSSNNLKNKILKVAMGTPSALNVTCTSTDGSIVSGMSAKWTSSNTKVAVVDEDGNVTGVKKGKCNIAVRIGNFKKTIQAEVVVPVASIAFKKPSSYYYPVGSKVKLTAAVSGISGKTPDNKNVSWGIDKSDYMTLDSKNILTMNKVSGSAYTVLSVNATDGYGATNTKNIYVTEEVKSLKLNKSKSSTTAGYYVYLTPTLTASDGTSITASAVQWTTSNTRVAYIDGTSSSYATIRCPRAGSAVIKASYGGKSATCTVKVTASSTASYATGIYVNGLSDIAEGGQANYRITAYPSSKAVSGKKYSIRYAYNESGEYLTGSKISDVAKISGSKLTAVAPGKVCVYVQAKNSKRMTLTNSKIVTIHPKSTVFSISGNSTMMANTQQALTIKATDILGNDVSGYVNLLSSKPKIATVDNYGKVFARKAGKTVITATYGKQTQKFSIEVREPQTSITIKGSHQMTVGSTTTLKTAVSPKNATNKDVTWSIQKVLGIDQKTVLVNNIDSYATITQKGVLTAKAKGSVYVKATAADGSEVTSTEYIVQITDETSSISVDGIGESVRIKVNEVLSASASVMGKDGEKLTSPVVTYTSSNEKVAKISNSNITGVSRGNAKITASYGNLKKVFTVYVEEPLTQIAINGDDTMINGGIMKLTAEVYPTKDTNKKVVWSISEAYDTFGDSVEASTIATIDSKGKITAKGCGKVTVMVVAEDGYGAFGIKTIEIRNTPTELKVYGKASIAVGSDAAYTVVAFDSDGESFVPDGVKFKSSDKRVATVADGFVTGVKHGTVEITASYGNLNKKVSVTVQ